MGQIPDWVIYGLARQLIHRIAVGNLDISGDDFGTMFAKAIGGEHRARPLGIADVVLNGDGWSVKTVKHESPFEAKSVRLISGRCSPDHSLGIKNPHADLAATGKAVLSIWNARVSQSLREQDALRIVVLIRNMQTMEYALFEEEARRFAENDYAWDLTKQGNIKGVETATGEHVFTWQFHGSQLTIMQRVPGSAIRFWLTRRPAVVTPEWILDWMGYSDEWVRIWRPG